MIKNKKKLIKNSRIRNEFIYSGEITNGTPNGNGKSISLKNKQIYIGQWKNGKYHGIGRLIDGKYSTYEGQFIKGKKSGYGRITFVDNLIISMEGNWINDKLNGASHILYDNNSKYIGNIINFSREGKGKYVFPNGNFFIGKWSNNIRNGKGKIYGNDFKVICQWINDIPVPPYKIVYSDGIIYRGFCNDEMKPHGYGTMTNNDKTIYSGEWLNGKRNGMGIVNFENVEVRCRWVNNISIAPYQIIYDDGSCYCGECNDQYQPHGYGAIKYYDKSTYTGYWLNGKRHGSGFYLFANYDYYSGGWFDDLKHGMGIYYSYTGEHAHSYMWSNNEPQYLITAYYY